MTFATRVIAFAMLATPVLAQPNLSASCAKCHPAQARQSATPMALALEKGETAAILRSNPRLTFTQGQYRYEIRREGDRSLYSVTDGTSRIEEPIAWAFGRGQAGQTYLFQHNGVWRESRVSYYNSIGQLDLTMGAGNAPAATLDQAAGREMNASDVRDCFGCHSTGGIKQDRLHWDTLQPGVNCENCHGTSAAHVASQKPMPKLSELSTEEMSDRCGACHRTWAQVQTSNIRGLANVRFQPYRLTNSRCYDAADPRIRCAACHDVHAELARAPKSYDGKCLACHTSTQNTKVKVCHTANSDCTTCHMPKFELPGSHYKFTDHQIRIVKANETYPN